MINTFIKIKRNGFTLVEVMIVVAIVALLAAIAIPNYTRHTRRARATEAVATMSMIRQAMRDYFINTSEHFNITTGNIDSALPTSVTAGVPTPVTAGVDIDVGVAQYFSNAAFTVNATTPVSARFTNPGPVDFIITANGSDSVACGTSDCAINGGTTGPVADFRLEMDNTGRTFISFDNGDPGTWNSY